MPESSAAMATEAAKPPVKGLASLAAALGLGAVTAAAACCVLPLALASIGVGAGLAGSLAALAGVRVPLLILSALAVAAAWIMWWRRRQTNCAPGDACAADAQPRRPLVALIAATALVSLAGTWSSIEPTLMKWVS